MATNYITPQWLIPENSNQDKKSYSFDFDGTNYIDIGLNKPANLNLTGDMSITAWIKPNSVTVGTDCVVGDLSAAATLSQYCLEINRTAGKISALANGNYVAVTGATSLVAGTWYHIGFTRTGSTGNWDYVVYLNGVSDGAANTVHNPSAQQGSAIGRFGQYSGAYFDGNIAEVAIFDYALTAGNVTSLYGDATDGVGNPMDLTTKPVGYWSADSSTFGSVFNVQNKATELYTNYSFDFDGVNDYIDCGNDSSLQPTSAYSYSAWFKADDIVGTEAIISNTTRGFLTRLETAKLKVWHYNDGSTWVNFLSVATIVADTWYHMAVTWDLSTTTLKLYINGILDNNITTATAIDYYTDDFNIGAYAGANPFDGKIAEVSVWNSALTAGNVTTIYNSGKPTDLTSLSPVAWWRLGEQSFWDGTNWVVRDQIGSNDGTSANMATDDLVGDAPNTSGSGTSSGLAVEDRTGDLKYSESNAVSFNMAYGTRVTSVP